MSYFPQTTVKISEGPNLDAFARLRISSPETLFSSTLRVDDNPNEWDTILTGAGSTTFNTNQASLDLDVTIASGDRVVRQTKRYIEYLPGKSQLILLTGNFLAGTANCIKRIGFYDDDNGLFFSEQNGLVSVNIRSNITSTPVTTSITQSNWNIDKLDGTGVSGITLDSTKSQIFLIDFEWLGVGRVRFGIVKEGEIHYIHEYIHANLITSVYMSTYLLPVRYEIENIGALSVPASMRQICSAVISEGGKEIRGYDRSVTTGITPHNIGTTFTPILSIRPALLHSGQINRASLLPDSFELLSADQDCEIQIILNGTLGGSPAATWTAVPGHSLSEYDVTASIITGGTVLFSSYATVGEKSSGADKNVLESKNYLSVNYDGTSAQTLTVAARTLTLTSDVYAAFHWREIDG